MYVAFGRRPQEVSLRVLWTVVPTDGPAPDTPLGTVWRADHVTFANSQMSLVLDNTPDPSLYSSGQYRSLGFHGYGCFEARLKPAAGSIQGLTVALDCRLECHCAEVQYK